MMMKMSFPLASLGALSTASFMTTILPTMLCLKIRILQLPRVPALPLLLLTMTLMIRRISFIKRELFKLIFFVGSSSLEFISLMRMRKMMKKKIWKKTSTFSISFLSFIFFFFSHIIITISRVFFSVFISLIFIFFIFPFLSTFISIFIATFTFIFTFIFTFSIIFWLSRLIQELFVLLSTFFAIPLQPWASLVILSSTAKFWLVILCFSYRQSFAPAVLEPPSFLRLTDLIQWTSSNWLQISHHLDGQ